MTNTAYEQFVCLLMDKLTKVVLTKPDLVGDGDRSRWIEDIKKENATYKHGCFLTKLSTTDEKVLDWVRAREIESLLFDTKWKAISSKRLGVANLGEHLSAELSSMILEK